MRNYFKDCVPHNQAVVGVPFIFVMLRDLDNNL